jgi:hypothetical protein
MDAPGDYFVAALLIEGGEGSMAYSNVITVSGETGGNDNGNAGGNDGDTFVVSLSPDGIASADTHDASWHLYEAATDTLLHEEFAIASPVDFSAYMEGGKSYYVVVDEISAREGEYRSESVIFKWLFKNEYINGDARFDLPELIDGVSYTAFADGMELATNTFVAADVACEFYGRIPRGEIMLLFIKQPDVAGWMLDSGGGGCIESANISIRING